MKPSTQKLYDAVAALEEPRLKKFLKKIESGYFHDFDGVPDTPAIVLVSELFAYGLGGIADRAINGEFDASKEESDDWAKSLDGMMAFDDPEVVEIGKAMMRKMVEDQGGIWHEALWDEFIESHRMS
jgi:hypothetical protein